MTTFWIVSLIIGFILTFVISMDGDWGWWDVKYFFRSITLLEGFDIFALTWAVIILTSVCSTPIVLIIFAIFAPDLIPKYK